MRWSPVGLGDLDIENDAASEIRSLAFVDGAYVATGTARIDGRDREGVLWYSPDLAEWSALDGRGAGYSGDEVIYGISELGNTLVAVGSAWTKGDLDAAVWLLGSD